MNSKKYPIVVIGGSIASISFIRTLRETGNNDSVLLIYGEDRLPYKRTKINKNMVRGFDKDDFIIADKAWYQNNNVELLNIWATSIDAQNKQIFFEETEPIEYNKLLLATGAGSVIPRIAGIEPAEMHSVQNAADVERLLEVASNKQRFLIVGGGVEGIETADQLIRKGKEVILASRMKYPLQKLFPHEFIQPLEEAMLKRGVQLYSGVSVNSVERVGDHFATKLRGDTIEFDEIVSSTGTLPNIQLAKSAGLNTEKGIVVDEWMHTSNEDILAAGDVAQHHNGIITGLWHAAEHQGKLAALNLFDKKEKHTLPPYRLKTEVFNLFLFSAEYEKLVPNEYEIVKEDEKGVKRWLYFKDDKLKAALMLNDGLRAKQYQQALMEEWSKKRFKEELPLQAPLSFNFSPSF
ncbi:NAD(P)/FAD-dependent oxidoreductase [Carboxylicivirga caseinilyticus]|uniref:NAD(P)/FAD-dependent oxidoreductase n=1 Tax=Carboxylicivirga caseinilyticus TaxID=3417572 RepID=UPI003D33C8CA|nr:FAD-dependent oxidoreductase [Marinilabiliaceae bacterium A049]